MTPTEVLDFLRANRLAVQASRGADETIQAALVGFAVTDAFEIVFDTLDTTRKIANLAVSPRVALVIGGWSPGDERTVQYEGIADQPTGDELECLKRVYFATWPDGPSRACWPGLVYVRVRPTWIRYSDFSQTPPIVVEFTSQHLRPAPANEH